MFEFAGYDFCCCHINRDGWPSEAVSCDNMKDRFWEKYKFIKEDKTIDLSTPEKIFGLILVASLVEHSKNPELERTFKQHLKDAFAAEKKKCTTEESSEKQENYCQNCANKGKRECKSCVRYADGWNGWTSPSNFVKVVEKKRGE